MTIVVLAVNIEFYSLPKASRYSSDFKISLYWTSLKFLSHLRVSCLCISGKAIPSLLIWAPSRLPSHQNGSLINPGSLFKSSVWRQRCLHKGKKENTLKKKSEDVVYRTENNVLFPPLVLYTYLFPKPPDNSQARDYGIMSKCFVSWGCQQVKMKQFSPKVYVVSSWGVLQPVN